MRVFRAHIKPTAGKGDPKVSFEYCLKEKVIGVGWQAEELHSTKNWEEYYAQMSDCWNDRRFKVVAYIKNNIKKGDLIWTRNNISEYYLCKVRSGWEYYATDKAKEADVVNIVRCYFAKIPYIDEVPGKVLASLCLRKSIQGVGYNQLAQYSKCLWNKYSPIDQYDDVEYTEKGIFTFLSAEATEDIIFIYLQLMGWMVIPNSRKTDTKTYEYYLINPDTKERAIVQVKTGNVALNPNSETWTRRKEKVFLFQSNGIYINEPQSSNIICIEPNVIEKFMLDNKHILPAHISHWVKVCYPNE